MVSEEKNALTGPARSTVVVAGLVGLVVGVLGSVTVTSVLGSDDDADVQLARACQDTVAAADRVEQVAAAKVQRGDFTPAVQTALSDAVSRMDSAAGLAPAAGPERKALLRTASAYAALEVSVADYADAPSWNSAQIKRLLASAEKAAQNAEQVCAAS